MIISLKPSHSIVVPCVHHSSCFNNFPHTLRACPQALLKARMGTTRVTDELTPHLELLTAERDHLANRVVSLEVHFPKWRDVMLCVTYHGMLNTLTSRVNPCPGRRSAARAG